MRPRLRACMRTGTRTLGLVVAALALSRCRSAPPGATPAAEAMHRMTRAEVDLANAAWERVVRDQMDVEGFDPNSECAGYAPAKKFGFRNWYPNSSAKCTLCGEVRRFEFFDGLGNEADWNIYVIPHDNFKRLLKGRSREWHNCACTSCPGSEYHCAADHELCMEAEVTPRRGLYDNPWFPRRKPDSYRPPCTVCAYGPWVSEMFHGYRPEIHPVELLWWKEKDAPSDFPSYLLFWLQDGSTRFDLERHFGWVDPAPWVPWARLPKYGRYFIAYEVQGDAPAQFWTSVRYAEGVVSAKHPEFAADENPGPDHSKIYNSRVVAVVHEEEARDEDLGVAFSEPFEIDGKVRGFVILTSVVGEEDGCGGYLVVNVTRGRQPAPPRLESAEPSRARVAATALEGSLRNGSFRGETRLVADIEVRRGRGSAAPNADLRGVHAVEFESGGTRTPLRWSRVGMTGDYRIRSVPVFDRGEVVLSLPRGREAYVAWEGTAFKPLPARLTPIGAVDDEAARGDLARLLGGPVREGSSVKIRRVSGWAIEPEFAYASLREGEASPEDESPWAEQLNDLLERHDTASVSALLGSRGGFQSQWDWSAVSERTRQPAETRIRFEPGSPLSGVAARVWFPPASEILRVDATITAVDPAGHRGTSTTTVWSHFLSGEAGALQSELLLGAAARANLGTPPLIDPCTNSTGHHPMAAMTPAARRFLIGATLARQMAEDGIATIDELLQLKAALEDENPSGR